MAIDPYVKAMFGENAVHVPAWVYIQDAEDGTVSFVGGSRTDAPHPLRYGSTHTHQLIVGELIVRPHLVVATDKLRGVGLAGLASGDYHDEILGGDVLVRTGQFKKGAAW